MLLQLKAMPVVEAEFVDRSQVWEVRDVIDRGKGRVFGLAKSSQFIATLIWLAWTMDMENLPLKAWGKLARDQPLRSGPGQKVARIRQQTTRSTIRPISSSTYQPWRERKTGK
jgi:hypothetical protein